MAVHSKLYDVLPEGYGYVLLVGVGSTLINAWMSFNVMQARKKYGVEFPKLYSDESTEFNCIQRVHQNTLETHPTFLFCLLTSGLQYPKISASAGLVYMIGRIVFAKGYTSGDPKKRRRGAFAHIAELVLLGGTVSLAAHLLEWC